MHINILRNILCTAPINNGNSIRNIIIDNKMPTLYLKSKLNINEEVMRSVYSIEHILPRSYLDKSHYNDMHNIVKTINELNVMRGNYKYIDEKVCNFTDKSQWRIAQQDNIVNHKERLFIPNKCSRGFISRALLYMSYEYNYKLSNIIDIDILKKWYFKYPPNKKEMYHNTIVGNIQKKDNIFISKYDKKCKKINKYLESL